MNKTPLFFDSTLRDGNHAIKHSIRKEDIESYCQRIDNAGLEVVIVGHGNGLGASTLQTGLALLTDKEILTTAKDNLSKTKLGTFLIPGYGTIKTDIAPALDYGVDLVCVAAHCTEANVTRQHIEYVRSKGKEAYGVLMMYHMTTPERLADEAYKMQEYGAMGVIIMDSAGASTPIMVSDMVKSLKKRLSIKIGFHPHNNLGLAVGNAYLALELGVDIIDSTIRGFGAGAGNCQLEVLVALLEKAGIQTGVDLYSLLDASEDIIAPIWPKGSALSSLSIISGISGVFSTFTPHVLNAAKEFNVDPRDIFIELGKRKVVGGQEDVVIDIAMNIAQITAKDETSYLLESLL